MERTVTIGAGAAAPTGNGHRVTRLARQSLAALVLFLVVGCSSGGNTPVGALVPAGTSLSGWWWIELGVAFGTDPAEYITIPVNALHQGSNFSFCAEMGVVSGSTITFADPEAIVPALTMVNSDRLEGMGTETDPMIGTITTTVVMTRPAPAPSGTLTATGMLDGQPVAVSSTAATGVYEVVDPDDCNPPCPAGSASIQAVDCSDPSNLYSIEIRVLSGPPMLGNVYTIGPDAEFDFDTASSDAFAMSGTFTLTRADAAVGGRMMGTYDVVLDTGESISGAFDVEVADLVQP